MEGAADAKVGNLLSMTAFKQGQVESVVKQPCLWLTTGSVPVAGGEAATRWGRTQTSGTEATSDRPPLNMHSQAGW